MMGIRKMMLFERKLKRHKEQLLTDYKNSKEKLLVEVTKMSILKWVIDSKQRCYDRNHEKYSFLENDLALYDIGWLDTELGDCEWNVDMYCEEVILLIGWL